MERPFNYETFMGRKDDAAYVTVNMLMRFYHTYDLEYARLVYPFIRETGDFWEDYLVREGDPYAIVNSCGGEAGVWNSRPDFNACRDEKNAPLVVSHVRGVFKGLIDISAELGVDAGPPRKNGGISWTTCPRRPRAASAGPVELCPAIPFWRSVRRRHGGPGGGGAPGQDPSAVLKSLRDQVERVAYPNGYPFRPGGGVESASVIPQRINGMLLEDADGIEVFASWPKDQDARFGALRAVGAFLVSSELRQGRVQNLLIQSEKGGSVRFTIPGRARLWSFTAAARRRASGWPERRLPSRLVRGSGW